MTQEEINSLRQQLVQKIMAEFDEAVLNNSLDLLAEKYGLFLEKKEMFIIDKRNVKIFVIGALASKKKDLQKVCKELEIEIDKVDFFDDYSKMPRFSLDNLRNSLVYSDVLVGPTPHKMKDLGFSKSLLSDMEKNSEEYPRVIPLRVNGELKITKTSFKNGLKQTRLYESNI